MWEKMKQRRDVEFHPLSGFIIKLQGQTQGKNARDAHKPTLYIQMFHKRTHRCCMHVRKERMSNKLTLPSSLSLSQSHTHTHTHASTHRKRFKQTHLCFIALVRSVCSRHRSQTHPMSPSAAIQYTQTQTSQ